MRGIGSVCSGVGGLDLALENVFGEQVSWMFEYEEGPSKVLAHHWPNVPNYGDLTTAQWAELPRVRVMGGGTPCQDLSGAGKRAGMTEGTRSNLWVQMREGIATLRPEYVVWENVRGAYSARADSEVEREPGLLGGTGGGYLRALGRVLGDLSSLGYDAGWVGVRAAEVGAPHNRYRVFVVARDASADAGSDEPERWGDLRNLGGAPATGHREGDQRERLRDASGDSSATDADATGVGRERILSGSSQGPSAAALDSPTDTEDNRLERSRAARYGRDGSPDGDRVTADADDAGRSEQRRAVAVREEQSAVEHFGDDATWGVYGPAVRRWEAVTGQLAQAATKPDGKNGSPRLAAEFAEWMMGWPTGWVTDPAIGLTRNQQLKAIGNGVVTMQAEFGIRYLLGVFAHLAPHSKESTE